MPAVAKKQNVKKEVKKPNTKKVKKTNMKEEVKKADMKEEVEKPNMEEDKNAIVEYYGQQVTVADKERMEPIILAIRRKSTNSDLENFVAKFPEFLSEGTLVIDRLKKLKCIICLKYGHPHEICPKTWKDGKRIKLCYVCKEGGLPHPKCKQSCCFYCGKEGHIARDCPEEKQETNEGQNNEENMDVEGDEPVEQENAAKLVAKKKGKNNNKKPLQENKKKSILSPKLNKKMKAK